MRVHDSATLSCLAAILVLVVACGEDIDGLSDDRRDVTGQQIAFVSDRDGYSRIYAMSDDGNAADHGRRDLNTLLGAAGTPGALPPGWP